MGIKNVLAKKLSLLIFLVPLVTTIQAEDTLDIEALKNAPEEKDIPVAKLSDIRKGKYSKHKNIEKPPTPKAKPQQENTKPVKQTKKKKNKKTEVVIKARKVTPKEIVKKEVKQESKAKPEQKKQDEIDLMKAYSALMRASNKTAPKKAKPIETRPIKTTTPVSPPKPKNANPNSSGSTGWLYLGKFSQGQWDKKNIQVLGLKGVLPKANNYYSIRVHSNIRKNKPSKGKMPSVIKVLSSGAKVQILQVHNSGNSGHYWAKVKW